MAAAMSAEHKAALAKGRRQAKSIRDYLEALEKNSRPGRRLSKDEIRQKIDDAQQQAESEDDPAKRVELIQKRLDYEERLADHEDAPDMDELEAGFVAAAKEYSERKGITYTAWREAGVPASALRDAGVPRTRRSSS